MTSESEDKLELENPEAKSSMNNWFPKIRDCEEVTHPKTVKVEMNDDSKHHRKWYNEEDVVEAIEHLGTGYPVFVRTDMASNKHRMKEASRIESEGDIRDTILHLIEFNETASLMGLPYESLYLREWVELEHHFKAFQETPIAKEVRFFIADGEVLGGHFY